MCFVRTKQTFALDGDTAVTVLPPLAGGTQSNERGLTVLCARGAYEVLMTGDMDEGMEAELLRTYPLPDVELMLAGHHGSRYSNSERLLAAVRPETVIVSVGADNWYGHPSPEALERFEQAGAQVLRTDQTGTVTVQAWPSRMQKEGSHAGETK